MLTKKERKGFITFEKVCISMLNFLFSLNIYSSISFNVQSLCEKDFSLVFIIGAVCYDIASVSIKNFLWMLL